MKGIGRLKWAIAALLLLVATVATAIEQVRVSPSFVTVNAIRPRVSQMVSVSWQVDPFQGMAGPQQLLSKGAKVETDQGSRQMISTVGGLPPQMVNGPVVPSLTFPDALEITRDLIGAALDRGAQRVLYTRNFSNQLVNAPPRFDLPPALGGLPIEVSSEQSFSISFTTNSTGSLVIFGAEIRFDQGVPLRVLKVGEDIRVFADLSYAGSGPFEAVWEIADEGSPDGVPLFRPLRRVRRFLAAGQRVTLEGPRLRTLRAGPHLVRLRVVDPVLSFELPTLRYLVGGARAKLVPAIHWQGPPILAEPGAELAWSRVSGAAAYRLEIWEAEGARKPAIRILRDSLDPEYQDRRSRTGEDRNYEGGGALARPRSLRWRTAKLLSPGATEIVLDAGLLGELEPEDRYAWRIVALDPERRVIARSAVRWLRTASQPAAGAP